MIDGVALEEKCRYLRDRNCVVGICREHAANVRTRITSMKVIEDLDRALNDEKNSTCCYGKEATVVAIAPYSREDHYSPTPILLSPSCKTETGHGLADWVKTTIKAWNDHPHGARLHGPIWALATDGDAAFRLARFLICLEEPVDRNSKLGRILYQLVGMNCRTGQQGICSTCDPKHVMKRM